MNGSTPTYPLTSNTILFRLYSRWAPYRAEDGSQVPGSPVWFCDDDAHRYDLPRRKGGTCYTSTTPLCSFLEVFRDIAGTGVDETLVRERKLAEVAVGAGGDLQIVDVRCPSNATLRNVTPELIHTTADYTKTQALAERVFDENLDGVSGPSVRDPNGTTVVAVFARTEGQDTADVLNVRDDREIPVSLMYEAAEAFGVAVKRAAREYPVR